MRNKIKYFFFSILTVIAISINKKMIYEKLLPNLNILKLSFIVMAILTIALYLFYKRYNKRTEYRLDRCRPRFLLRL